MQYDYGLISKLTPVLKITNIFCALYDEMVKFWTLNPHFRHCDMQPQNIDYIELWV